MEELFQVAQVGWVAVGQRPFEMIPDKFVGVEFGRIPRESMGVQTGMLSKELLDPACLVGIAAVPQKDHVAAPVFEQLPQEGDHFRRADVFVRMKSGVEGDALAPGGYGDRRDGRDFVPVPGTAQKRRLPSRGPGPADARNQQESTFVEEGQIGSQPFGLFLYAASDSASSARWLPRPVPGPASPAFGSSTPCRSKGATHGWGGSGPAADPRSGERFA